MRRRSSWPRPTSAAPTRTPRAGTSRSSCRSPSERTSPADGRPRHFGCMGRGQQPRSSVLRVALAQVDCALGDVEENLRRTATALAQARDQRADLVVFPELNLTGYSLGSVPEDVSLAGVDAVLGELLDGDDPMGAIVGFAEAGRLHTYNSAAYVQGGRVRHVHRKLYLPT